MINPPIGRAIVCTLWIRIFSLDFGFLIRHMFANYWVIFFHLQFLWCGSLVFSGRVEVPGSGCGNQFNFVTHDEYSSNLLTTGAQFIKNNVDPLFIDNTHAVRRHAQLYKTLFALNPEAMLVQVWQKPAPSFVIGMGYIISGNRVLTRYLTDSGHQTSLQPA
jgi:hypothetical protein